jgi:leucyl-tRNA synthetase
LVVDDVVEMGVQINGKVRGTITVAKDASEEVARAAALAEARIAPHLEGKTVRKVIYVPGKILNLIVG